VADDPPHLHTRVWRNKLRPQAQLCPPSGATYRAGDAPTLTGSMLEVTLTQSASSPFDLLDAMPDGVLLVHQDGRITFANRQAAWMFGYARDELLTVQIEALLPQWSRATHVRQRERHMADPRARPMGAGVSLLGLRKDGSEFPVEISLSSAEIGNDLLILSAVRDVSQRHQMEARLGSAEELTRVALDAIPSHIAVLDGRGTVLAVNRAWERFARDNAAASTSSVGLGANYLEVCQAASLNGSSDSVSALNGILSVLRGETDAFEMEYACHSPREKRWFAMSVTPMEASRARALVTHTNVTKRRALQVELEAALTQIGLLKDRLEAENTDLRRRIATTVELEEIVGSSRALKEALHKVDLVAATDATVLLTGETGTGKDRFAHAIVKRSHRAERPFVIVNCAALPANLIESDLFGHEKGAFTGATSRRQGRFELADGGTIFLDEIGDFPLEAQVKLLRVLQSGEFERLGSEETITVDVRVIAATNRDLAKAMEQGRLRADLFYRLNVFPIDIAPLRERKEDIPLLVWYFVANAEGRYGKHITTIPEQTMDALMRYDWPGNVRELEHVVERAMILSRGTSLLITESFTPIVPDATPAAPADDGGSLEHVERAHIIRTLQRCGWKVKGDGNAADLLGLRESTLRYRMKKLGIERPGG